MSAPDPLAAARASLIVGHCARGAGRWDCDRANDGSVCSDCFARRHLRAALTAHDAVVAERDAYKKAKAENDERFQIEAIGARIERDRLAAQLAVGDSEADRRASECDCIDAILDGATDDVRFDPAAQPTAARVQALAAKLTEAEDALARAIAVIDLAARIAADRAAGGGS